jgi:ketosteroid isomerase-like protein
MASSASASPPDESDVFKAYEAYLLASFSLDAERVATYYDEPFMFVSAARTVTVATRADAEGFLSPGFKDLQQAGYAKTEFPELKSHSLGEGLAVISGRGVRVTRDGRELGTFGITYIWRNLPDGWKLSVMIVHDPKKLLPLI